MLYRIYRADTSSRLSEAYQDITCVSDEGAIEYVRQLNVSFCFEIWQDDRQVARILPRNSRHSYNSRLPEPTRVVSPLRIASARNRY